MKIFEMIFLTIIILSIEVVIFYAGMEYNNKLTCQDKGGAYSLDYGVCIKINKKDLIK